MMSSLALTTEVAAIQAITANRAMAMGCLSDAADMMIVVRGLACVRSCGLQCRCVSVAECGASRQFYTNGSRPRDSVCNAERVNPRSIYCGSMFWYFLSRFLVSAAVFVFIIYAIDEVFCAIRSWGFPGVVEHLNPTYSLSVNAFIKRVEL